MQSTTELYKFLSNSVRLKPITTPDPIKIRFYSQLNIHNNHAQLIEEQLLKHFDCIEVLPSIQVDSCYGLYSNDISLTDIALLYIGYDLETNREPQLNRFIRWTENVRSKATMTLVMLHSNMPEKIIEDRKFLYETSVPNVTVTYFPRGTALYSSTEDLPLHLDCMCNFISKFKDTKDTKDTKDIQNITLNQTQPSFK